MEYNVLQKGSSVKLNQTGKVADYVDVFGKKTVTELGKGPLESKLEKESVAKMKENLRPWKGQQF